MNDNKLYYRGNEELEITQKDVLTQVGNDSRGLFPKFRLEVNRYVIHVSDGAQVYEIEEKDQEPKLIGDEDGLTVYKIPYQTQVHLQCSGCKKDFYFQNPPLPRTPETDWFENYYSNDSLWDRFWRWIGL